MAYAKHGTLVASTAATVTISGTFRKATLVNHGDDPIYFTSHGDADAISDPTVQGDDTAVCPAGMPVDLPCTSGNLTVKMISSSTPSYSLVGGAIE